MIRKIDDIRRFEELKGEWSRLLEASASNCLFLTWEWLYTWWKHLAGNRKLSILTVHSGGELTAIAPLALRPPRYDRFFLPLPSLEFLGRGTVGSDYLDLIIRHGHEEESALALADFLAKERLMAELAQLKRDGAAAAALTLPLRQRGWRISQAKTDICPFIKIAGHTWESFLRTLGAEHRYNVKRRLRKLADQYEVRFEQIRSEDRLREALPLLVALHNLRWRHQGGSDAFHGSAILAFHQELGQLALRRGWLRLFVLWLGETPAAALYGFNYNRTFSFYQAGFDPRFSKHSVGLVTMGLAIQSAIEEGADEYDLLHGDEEYKFQWAREARELERMELYPPNGRGLLYRGAVEATRAARRFARRVLPHALTERLTERMTAGGHIGI
jgi:CelD/BcsL family acetyltransferase involved in cellulose biosynthesis